MKKRSGLYVLIAFLVLALATLAGCGGSYGSFGAPGGANSASVSLSMTDDPPVGTTILSFEVTLNSAVLNPGSIDLLAGKPPLKIEIKRLETETALINTANVPPGTYTSIQLTFFNPQLTFRNDSSTVITVGGTSCPIGNVCEVNPTGSLTATIPVPSGSGALASGTPASFLVDVNLASLFRNDLTLDFTNAQAATLRRINLPTTPTGQALRLEDIHGIVKNKNTTINRFTLQTIRGDIEVAVLNVTQFEDCLANNFTCIANDQAVEVELGLLAGGVLYARKIEVEDDPNDAIDEGIEGFIYQIDDAIHFRMVVVDFLRGNQGILRGRRLNVMIRPGTQFQVRTGNLALPAQIEAAKTAFENTMTTSELQVGQHVEVRFRLLRQPSGSENQGLTVLETTRVRLRETHWTATVQSTALPSTFTVSSQPPIFGHLDPPVPSIQIFTSADTEFEDATGVGDLAGARVSLRGFLFKSTPTPIMFAVRVRKRVT